MKNSRFNSNHFNFNDPTQLREITMQKFTDASAESDGGLTHILLFFGHVFEPHDFRVQPFGTIADKILLLRKLLSDQNLRAPHLSLYMQILDDCMAVEKLRHLFVEQIYGKQDDAYLLVIDTVVLVLQRQYWYLDDAFAELQAGYQRYTKLSAGAISQLSVDQPLLNVVKQMLED